MLPESDVGVNDGRATLSGALTRAVRGGIFEELHKKDAILYEALFWSEVRKAADLQRRSPGDDDSTDSVFNNQERAVAVVSAGLRDATEATRDTIGLGVVLIYLGIEYLRDLW